MKRVRMLDIPQAAKHLLKELADFANDEGENCYPSNKTLCQYLSMSLSTLQRHKNYLISVGLLETKDRFSNGSRQTSNHYVITIDKFLSKNTHRSDDNADENSEALSNGGVFKVEQGGVSKVEHPRSTIKIPNINKREYSNTTDLHRGITIMVTDDPKLCFPVSDNFYSNLKSSYPDIDIDNELRKAERWLLSRFHKINSILHLNRFLSGWFRRINNSSKSLERLLEEKRGHEYKLDPRSDLDKSILEHDVEVANG